MNPVQEILEYGKRYWANEPTDSAGLSDMVEDCQERFNVDMRHFHTVQRQLSAAQRAWAAIIAEKERYDAVGWQAGSADFTRALHACLLMIPDAMNMDLAEAFNDVQRVSMRDEIELGEISSNSGSIPLAYDDGDGNDLPDYNDSLSGSEDSDGYSELADLISMEGGDQRGGRCVNIEQGNTCQDDEKGAERLSNESKHRPQNKRQWEDSNAFDPWKDFLRDQEPFLHPEFFPRRGQNIEAPTGDEEATEENKRKRMRF